MSASTLAFPKNESDQLYLPDVASNPQPGVYKDLIESARSRDHENSKIWDLFAFRGSFTVHLARFSQGVLRTPASISAALRELIAALTSYQNECRFCTQAHAAAASELFGNETLVWSVLSDLEASPLEAKERALLRFTSNITKNLPGITGDDVEQVRAAGWDDEAIYLRHHNLRALQFLQSLDYGRRSTGNVRGGAPASGAEHRQARVHTRGKEIDYGAHFTPRGFSRHPWADDVPAGNCQAAE
jgi:uncharacterized peroxidase-related enzyme